MNLFKKKIKGYIKYFKLESWWENLSKTQQRQIKRSLPSKDDGLSMLSVDSLLYKDISFISATKTQIITAVIQSSFTYPEDRDSIIELINKLENENVKDFELIDLHFLYSSQAKIIYKYRDSNNQAINDVINYCDKAIKISEKLKDQFLIKYPKSNLPSHYCFKQLAIIYEKEKKYNEALEIASQAKSQGWAGDNWDKRIEKLHNKLKKVTHN